MAQVERRPPRSASAPTRCARPNRITALFHDANTQTFRGLPIWHPICLCSHEEKLRPMPIPEIRAQAARGGRRIQDRRRRSASADLVGLHGGAEPVLEKNKWMQGKTDRPDRQGAGQGHHRRFLDLVVEENLDTASCTARTMSTTRRSPKILTYPNAIIGLGDGGAHVQFQSGFGFSTRLLGRMGAREAGHVAGAGGAPADLRTRPRPSASTTAACCARAWSPTS